MFLRTCFDRIGMLDLVSGQKINFFFILLTRIQKILKVEFFKIIMNHIEINLELKSDPITKLVNKSFINLIVRMIQTLTLILLHYYSFDCFFNFNYLYTFLFPCLIYFE